MNFPPPPRTPFKATRLHFDEEDAIFEEPMDCGVARMNLESVGSPFGSPSQTPEPRTPPVVMVCDSPMSSGIGRSGAMVPPSPCITRQDSILTLKGAPQSPRQLIRRGLNIMDEGMASGPRPFRAAARSRRTNVNPFTPTVARDLPPASPMKRPMEGEARSVSRMLRRRTSVVIDEEETSNRRLETDFELVKLLGRGEFGTVSLYRHRLDGVLYAIKRSNEPIHGRSHEQQLLREVYAHAVLQEQAHIVRYYSAWQQDGHMIIQNEFCDCGSVADQITTFRATGEYYSEQQLCQMLIQTAHGLAAMHAQDLVHLDIKPGNVFIKGNEPSPQYKIGDLGHVTKISAPNIEDEGDCRYLPKEVLREDYTHIAKADVFSLGVMLFEAATLCDLPLNGPDWHRLRDGSPPSCERYSTRFNHLLLLMLNPDAATRPSAEEVLQHPLLLQEAALAKGVPSKATELQQLLLAERKLTDSLLKKLQHLPGSTPPTTEHVRLSRTTSVSF